MRISDWIGDTLESVGEFLLEVARNRKLVSSEWIEEGFAYAVYAQPRPNFPFVVDFYDYVENEWRPAGPRNAEYAGEEIHLTFSSETPSEYIRRLAAEYYRDYPDKPNSEYPIGRAKTPPKFPRYRWM
jgi:hypothetical protein